MSERIVLCLILSAYSKVLIVFARLWKTACPK